MIFGVSKAIAREHSAMADSDVLIMDLTDVPMLGVTASLAIENAIKDASEQGRNVLIVGATSKVKKRLDKFGISRFVPEHYMFVDRVDALKQAVALVNPHATDDNTPGVGTYTDTYS